MSENGNRTLIVVAVLGVLGTLGAAVIANWDKFSPSQQATNDGAQVSPVATPSSTPSQPSSPEGAQTSTPTQEQSGPGEQAPIPTKRDCVVDLVSPAANAVLTQRRVGGGKVETIWEFLWRDCPEASRYHLYVIGPGAINPIVDTDTLTAAAYQLRDSHYGITQRRGWTWMVRAYVNGKWGDWSEKRTFDVAPPD